MQSTNRIALKEWAVVCTALAAGRQIITVRKGGLLDDGGFQVRYREFWLFPGEFHQGRERLALDAGPYWEQALSARPPQGIARIQTYAIVHDLLEIRREAIVESIGDETVWSAATLLERFRYREPGLAVPVLRIYRVPRALDLALSADAAGCRSWLELSRKLSTVGAVAVLPDDEFARRCDELRNKLAKATG